MKIWDSVNRCLFLVNRYLITILLPDFLYAIQITIQLTGHSAIKHILTICVLDVSCNRKLLYLYWTPYSCFFVQWRQLPVDDGASVSCRMVQLLETAERPRARGHVEPLVHRERDVQAKRPKQYSAPGNHHPAVSGDSTGTVIIRIWT